MTVLEEYERLESTGVWSPGDGAQRRDVLVSIGEATLVLYDMSETALAHWSLPALDRLNPGQTPAIYSPGADAPDRLEIADTDMIAAIERVQTAIRRARGRPGRLRAAIAIGVLALAIGLGTLWLPGALARYAASILPDAARAEIGRDMMAHIRRRTGPACNDPAGARALFALERRLFPDGRTRLRVLPGGLTGTAHLPGGWLLAAHTLVEDFETPDVLAGYALAEHVRRSTTDPATALLEDAGLRPTLALLTTGHVPDATLAALADIRLIGPPAPVDQTALLDAFSGAGVSPTAYAFARDISGETTLPLVEGAALATAATPLLTDGQWLALQQICEG